MGAMSAYTRSEAFKKASPAVYPFFNNVMPESGGWSTAAFGSFIIKVLSVSLHECLDAAFLRERPGAIN
jgi:hypothetical protein